MQIPQVVDIPDDGVKGDAVGVDPERITAITPDQEDAAEGETEVTEACVMQHPGVVCCTKTTVLRNSDSETCTLTIQTVAQRDIVDGMECPTAAVNMPHLAALAAQALVASASEFSQRNNRGLAASVYTARRMDRHKQIKKVLQQGKVVEVLKTNKSEFGHENFVVLLEDSNLVIKAMFKPRVTGESKTTPAPEVYI